MNVGRDVPEEAIKVITYNVNHMGYEKYLNAENPILKFLLEQKADIVCIQEAGHKKELRQLMDSILSPVYPHHETMRSQSKESDLLGPTKMTVTVVESGTQHNVVPDLLHFIIDVRTNEFYQNEYVFEFLKKHMKKCELKARSFRLHSSSIPHEHPLVKRCIDMGKTPFGSPTLSDQALMPFPSLKLGPGESSRSHSADEFIHISEIREAIETYVQLLSGLYLR